ncbi:MAG: YciI family protein [Candidatus Obscuribacterales bacterium]|nr:YciI family protein [Candidatus Obscuribacterales bacterium]
MQFLILGYDGEDDKAIERRMTARPDHIALGDKMRDEGTMLYGAAILDEQEKMIGSVLICEFESRQQLDKWLEIEPYVKGDVWKKVEVKSCRVGPSFAGLKPQKV